MEELKLHSASICGDIIDLHGIEKIRHTLTVVLYDATTTKAHVFKNSLN